MAITLAEVKEYLRIDSDVEDGLIQSMILAAKAYLAGAVDGFNDYYSKDNDFAIKADMVAKVVIADLYEHRGEGETKYSRVIESMVRQLQNYPG